MKRFLFAIFIIVTVSGFSQSENKRIAQFNLDAKVAIQGYDPVAYFKQGKGLKGKKELSCSHEGVVYLFSARVNKEIFIKNPSVYEPQYGGWCAYAMGDSGEQVEVDPSTFKIVDGKLYLFYNYYFRNTLKKWNVDQVHLKAKADSNWRKSIQ
jgi:YHS domain-containing protein